MWGETAEFNRENELEIFLEDNDIPKRYFSYMKTLILTAAFEPDCTESEAYARLAKQEQISLKKAEMLIKRAVYLAWEHASTPSSVLFSKRLTPEEFLAHSVSWIRSKEEAFYRRKR